MLSERIQAQGPTYYRIPFIGHSRKGKTTRTEKRINGYQRLGVGEGLTVKKLRIFGGDGIILYLDCGDDYTTMSKLIELYTIMDKFSSVSYSLIKKLSPSKLIYGRKK